VDFIEGRSDALELSLKLYHAGELQLGYQQLMTEAPLFPASNGRIPGDSFESSYGGLVQREATSSNVLRRVGVDNKLSRLSSRTSFHKSGYW
jgi:hypothetical protein